MAAHLYEPGDAGEVLALAADANDGPLLGVHPRVLVGALVEYLHSRSICTVTRPVEQSNAPRTIHSSSICKLAQYLYLHTCQEQPVISFVAPAKSTHRPRPYLTAAEGQ
jgi:hypothetical protein